jgi:hypothetical protein
MGDFCKPNGFPSIVNQWVKARFANRDGPPGNRGADLAAIRIGAIDLLTFLRCIAPRTFLLRANSYAYNGGARP